MAFSRLRHRITSFLWIDHATSNHTKEQRSTVFAEVVTSYTYSLNDTDATIYRIGVYYTQKTGYIYKFSMVNKGKNLVDAFESIISKEFYFYY